MKAWDFFHDKFKRNGVDNNGQEIRIEGNDRSDDNKSASYDPHPNSSADYIQVGFYGNSWAANTYNSTPDIIGHEFTHSIGFNLSNLPLMKGVGEAGALGESFADFFGVLIEADSQINLLFGNGRMK